MAGGFLGKAKISEFQNGVGPFGGVQEILGLQKETQRNNNPAMRGSGKSKGYR